MTPALTEAGFVEAHGATRGRCRLLCMVPLLTGQPIPGKRGLRPFNEQMVLSYARQHGRIKRAEAMALCRLSEGQVKALLKRMCQSGLLTLEGAGPASYYRIGSLDRMKLDGIG